MSSLSFAELPAYKAREFVPHTANLGEWSQIEPLFRQLRENLARCTTAAELETWILNWGELSAALDEEGSRRYIAMTCNTADRAAEKAYLFFIEEIDPRLKPLQFELEQDYLKHPLRAQLPRERYLVFDRDTALHVELYRSENVPIETEEAKLGQQYQKLSGSLTVNFRGEEKTLVQMGRYLEEPDRGLRQEAWELVAKRRLEEADRFDDQFEELLKLREQIAANAGFSNYRDYAFRARGRFDYGPEDCVAFHEAIEKEVMPLLKALQTERRERLGVAALRPWDLAVDPSSQPPLRPFDAVEQLVERTGRIFRLLDPELASGFETMQRLKLLDLANRKGKAPGGYQSTLAESRLPFIFMNAVGLQRDVETMLHEAGHAFHALATRPEDLYPYRHAPIEFCEVASMSMELLGNEHLNVFYQESEARRARRDHLEGIVEVFPWIATVDAFQHWIYSHPRHSRADRTQAWLGLMDRFGGAVDWSGFEEVRAKLWHRQLHIYLHPFYYIEYGIAQLGALQIWLNSKSELARTLADYQRALALGGSRPLPELFTAAGCKFDFSRKTVGPLAALLRSELEKLGRPRPGL